MAEPETGVMWDADMEVNLFQSMEGHKPCGINKHFHMMCIQHKFYEKTSINISTAQLWAKLHSLWDIGILDSAQDPAFPEVKEQGLFSLPFDSAELVEDVASSEGSSTEVSSIKSGGGGGNPAKKQKSPAPLPPPIPASAVAAVVSSGGNKKKKG